MCPDQHTQSMPPSWPPHHTLEVTCGYFLCLGTTQLLESTGFRMPSYSIYSCLFFLQHHYSICWALLYVAPREILQEYKSNNNSSNTKIYHQEQEVWDFPGSLVVKTSPSNARGMGLVPGQGAKIPHAL